MDKTETIYRNMSKKLIDVFAKFPVVFLTGPRQSGKTTLTKDTFPDLPYVTLEDPIKRATILADSEGFFRQYPNGLIIDEAQNCPEIFSYVQVYVDQNKRPGMYLLTGSQNFLLNEKITQTLAGRVRILELLPLSAEEITMHYLKDSVIDMIFKGGYPCLYSNGTQMEPQEFYPSYIQTYLERDVRQIKNISSLTQFQKFLAICAGRVGQLIDFSDIGRTCGISSPTIREWISILEASYVIYTLQPYHLNISKRMTKSSKMYFYDTGVLCSLLGIRSVTDLSMHYSFGSIFENFVINDFLKKQYNDGEKKNMYFLRDSKGHEVDLLIPNTNGDVLYEIKSSSTFNTDFVKGLLHYKHLFPSSRGEIIYSGNTRTKFKEIDVKPILDYDLYELTETIFNNIKNDLQNSRIIVLNDEYLKTKISISYNESTINDVLYSVRRRIQIENQKISFSSGWSNIYSSIERFSKKFNELYGNEDQISKEDFLDIINYIPMSSISDIDRLFMRKTSTNWYKFQNKLEVLLSERKIVCNAEMLPLKSIMQQDKYLLQHGMYNPSFSSLLLNKYSTA